MKTTLHRLFMPTFILIGLMTLLTWIMSLPDTPDRTVMQSYIVQGESTEVVAVLVAEHGGRVTSRLPIIDGVGALLPTEALVSLQTETAVSHITPNATVTAADMQMSVVQIASQATTDYPEVVGANVVWDTDGTGPTGDGITIAVVDSGIDSQLPGLNKDAQNRDRLSLGVVFITDTITLTNRIIDENGHGTHIAGIIASSLKGTDDHWNGVAPNVDLISVQVLQEEGWGTYENVIRGIQWVVDNKDTYNIKVMNLSLVAQPQSPYWADPFDQAVMQAWADGIVVVAAAGNSGPMPMTIGVPGNNPYVITVGAFTDNFTPSEWSDDYIPPFSAAGPTLDAFVKPDVMAPGAHILSTMKASTYLAMEHPDYVREAGTHFQMAGTSQATAVVSGIAALILSDPANASLTPDQVKYRVMNTALLWIDPETSDALYSIWQQGVGRVNAPDAVFTDTLAAANYGLDILLDLSDPNAGYQGFTDYDNEAGEFYLIDAPASWAGGFGTWAGGFGTWAGGFGTWAGGFGTWAGGFGTWAGGFGTWAGGFGTWAGGFGTWAGGYSGWVEVLPNSQSPTMHVPLAGQYPWPSIYNDPAFLQAFQEGTPPATDTAVMNDEWIEEEDWAENNTTLYLPMVMVPSN